VYLAADGIVAFFVPGDAGVIAEGARFLRLFAPTFGFIGLQLALIGVFRAAGQMLVAMTLALVSQWVLQFPLALVLGNYTSWGLQGVWWAFPISSVLTTLGATAWFLRGDWKRGRLTENEKAVAQASEEILVEEGVR
jgi:Na+-driven multidrug efflux pump